MSKLIKIFFFICLIHAVSCKTKSNFKRLADNQIVYGKVKSITEIHTTLKEKFGELQKDGAPSISYFWFDEKSNLIKEQAAGSTWDSSIYKYNKENYLIEELCYDDAAIQAKRVYEYSDGNKKRKESYIYKNIVHINVSKFDARQNQIELNEYNDDGTPSTKHTYEYDNAGNKIKESVQLPNEGVNWTTYRYDSRNNKIEENYQTFKFTFKFQNFDKHGNWLKQTAISDVPFYIVERKIEYYE